MALSSDMHKSYRHIIQCNKPFTAWCSTNRTFIITFKIKFCIAKYKDYLDGLLIYHVYWDTLYDFSLYDCLSCTMQICDKIVVILTTQICNLNYSMKKILISPQKMNGCQMSEQNRLNKKKNRVIGSKKVDYYQISDFFIS